jgi:phosphatidylglycerol:prolipoprotein diacylglycerol transferase
MTFDPDGIHLSLLVISWYAVFVTVGALAGTLVTVRLVRQSGSDPEHVWNALIPVLLLGVIGARLWFVCFPPQSVIANWGTPAWFASHLTDVYQGFFAIWMGGFGLFGGVIGGSLGLWLYTRIHKLNFAVWADFAVLGLALAQTIARVGDGAAADLYGGPVGWGILVPDSTLRVAPYTDLSLYPLDSARFAPVFLYEALLAGIIFVILYALRRRLRPGDAALLYLALYGTGRFVLEPLRANVSVVGNVNISQVAAALAALIGWLLFLRRNRSATPLP